MLINVLFFSVLLATMENLPKSGALWKSCVNRKTKTGKKQSVDELTS